MNQRFLVSIWGKFLGGFSFWFWQDSYSFNTSACECFHEKVEMLHDKLFKYFFQKCNLFVLFLFVAYQANNYLLQVSKEILEQNVKHV